MILNYQAQKQILDNWCWAAVTSSISFFYNQNSSGVLQSALAAGLISNICSEINSDNPENAPPICDASMDIANALNYTGNYAGQISQAIAFNDIVQQINGGFPICCQILWAGFDQSHFVAIYGYESSNLIIGDPEAGIFTVDYNQFLSYRGGTWRRTIGTQHP